MKRMIVVLVGGALALTACSSSAAGSGGGDILGAKACDSYRAIQVDINAGVLTPDEVRTKMQNVNKDAQYASTPAISAAVTEVLAGLTQGSSLTGPAADMESACTSIGH